MSETNTGNEDHSQPDYLAVDLLAQHAAIDMPVVDIAEFRTQETGRRKLARHISRVALGSNTARAEKENQKLENYDMEGYLQHLGTVVEASVNMDGGILNPAVYEAAEQASTFLNRPNRLGYELRDAQNASVLKAVIREPAFIATDPSRAANILADLRDEQLTEHLLWRGMRYKRGQSLADANAEYSNNSVPAIDTLVNEDALWEVREDYGHKMRLKAEGTLLSIAEDLNWAFEQACLSSLTTLDLRLKMLAKLRSSGAESLRLEHTLFSSFGTEEQQERLRNLADDEQTTDKTKAIIQDILSFKPHRMRFY